MMKKIAELKNYFSRHLKLTPIFIAVFFLNGNLFAAEAVWTGDAGTNDWATSGNWSGITDVSELENATTVTIPTDATPYPEASTETSVTLNGKLIIGDGASVTFNGNVRINSITLGTRTIIKFNQGTGDQTTTITTFNFGGKEIAFGNDSKDVFDIGSGALDISSASNATFGGSITAGSFKVNSSMIITAETVINPQVTLTGNLSVTDNGSNTVMFQNGITGDYDFSSTANSTWFRGDVNVKSVNITKETQFLGFTNSITTTETQSYVGNIVTNRDINLIAGENEISIEGTVNGIGETISDIWNEYSEQYDILKNIYKADYKAETYHHNCGWIFDGEENVVFTDYNMTPWDVFQVCTQQVPEYIVKPSYHQFDSRLYFGLPFWMEKFRYDIINGSPHEECKASTQVHYLCSLTNIIDNQVRVTSKYSFTNIKVMYQRGSSAVTTQVIHSDDTIDYSRQKTRILDTPIVQDAFGPDLVYELLGYDIGDDSARRTGISNLLYGWQQQYQGELLCLGCPGIYAHDYLMLNDMFANMFGVCIVREVTHSFNTNTGFTTGIVPGMIGFSTDEQSGLIETTQNYLMMASLFASYSSQRRGLKNACEANMQLLADMEVARQKMDALCDYVNNWQTADTAYQIASTAGLGLLIYKTAKNMQTAFKVLKTTGEFVKFGKDLYKGAKACVNVVKGLKTMFTAIEAGGAAAAPETLGVSLVVTVIMFMIDALLDEFFEWFSNKNVCTLLPLWWENYPFVSGVKDGEKILIMPSNSTATGENTRSDAIDVESNDD